VAFTLPLIGALLLTPLAGQLATQLDIVDHPSAAKFHQRATPYLGGAAVAASILLPATIAAGASAQLWVILISALALSLIGLLDDRRLMPWWVKLFVEVVAAGALWTVEVRAGLFGVPLLDLALTVIWVVGVTNAINMLDNMDGLSSGVAAISALTFFAIAAGEGDFLVAAFSLAVVGGALGFLRWNFPPAKIFLGDSGTLLLGFLVAAIGLKLDLVGENGFIRSAVPILVLAVPILDTTLVVLARTRENRAVYQGGTDHSSHRLASLGLSARRIALTTYAVHAACCLVALWLLSAGFPTALGAVITMTVLGGGAIVGLLRVPYRPRMPEGARLDPAEQPPPR
jgi:UDP-GlcNAc:undecaprenyl-phosphate/decaprenyl-phosphate GlcNAc-1-phosphate transferase